MISVGGPVGKKTNWEYFGIDIQLPFVMFLLAGWMENSLFSAAKSNMFVQNLTQTQKTQ